MDRRSFLKRLGLVTAAGVTNPVHFLPPIGGWQSDVIVNPATTRLDPHIARVIAEQLAMIQSDFALMLDRSLLCGDVLKASAKVSSRSFRIPFQVEV